ncbi:MAG: carbohydrate ABC transporter permease [Treponema sp.]|uniref:carbohydrate ABC transporter permease n=1 Tax=Treponema sp. TaxID=166 RepID=UPI003FA2DD80
MIKTNKSFIYSMVLPSAVLLTVLSIFPLFFTIKNSFTDYYLLSKTRSSFIGVRNYVNIFKDAYFQKSLWNTVKFTVLAVIAETLFGLVLALFVNSLRKGQHLVRTLLLLPMLVPTVTAALIWQTMFSNNNGIINQMLEFVKMSPVNWLMDVKTAFNAILIIDIWQYTPLSFLLIYAELQTVPQSQYEAADIDGASYWNKLIHIILPDISTGIGMVVLLRTIDTFRLFDKINILTRGGPANSTATISQYIYQYGTKNLQIGYSGAASVIMTVAVLILASTYLIKRFKADIKAVG